MLDIPIFLVYNIFTQNKKGDFYMKANYVATKSSWSVVSIWHILFFWLIIPLIIMITQIIIVRHETIEFYNDRVVVKSGVLSKRERNTVFTSVMSVSIDQSIKGRMFGFGNVRVDVIGKWDVNTEGIKNPYQLKKYLEKSSL